MLPSEPFGTFSIIFFAAFQYWTRLPSKVRVGIVLANSERSELPSALSFPSYHLGVGPEDNTSTGEYVSVRFYSNNGLN
jgi:hypothetical protein